MQDRYQLGDLQAWSSFTFIRVLSNYADGLDEEALVKGKLHIPLGYVFVIEPRFGDDAQYKLPAGHRKNGEDPLETAVREVQGETGLHIPPDRFRYAGKEWTSGRHGPHWKILFLCYVYEHELRQMNEFDAENEGEQPKYFSIDEFYESVTKGGFMMPHFSMLERFGLILCGRKIA